MTTGSRADAFDLNAGVLAPVADEVDLFDLPVDGRLPDDLDGLLVRNGPNPFGGTASGSTMLDWWVGPGMVHGLAFGDGRCRWYRNRWVRTSGWAEANGEDEPPGLAVGDSGANVHVMAHGGRLLALGEGGVPHVLDGHLSTVGRLDYGGALPLGMQAHPKVDPASGELHFFRADWQPPFLQVGTIGADGRLADLRPVELPRPVMMHDFAITEHHDVVMDLGVVLDLDLAGAGAPIPLRWDDHHPARLGAVHRSGGAVRWFDVEPCFIQHVVNGYEVGDEIVLDAVRYPHFLRFDAEGGHHLPNPLGSLWRYRLDLATGRVAEGPLSDRAVELPRIDDRRLGRAHRRVIAVEQPTDREMRGVVVTDLMAGTEQRMVVPAGDQNSEAVFVPGGSGPGAEDDGWILVCVYRAATDTTDVVVLDAADVSGSPAATVRLPRRIPAGFHGSWIPSTALT